MSAARRPFPFRRYAITLVVILVLMVLPPLSSLIAQAMADAAGCTIYAGSAFPCPVGAIDIGALLYGMDYARWLILVTVPLGLVLLVVWLVWLLVALALWARNRSVATP